MRALWRDQLQIPPNWCDPAAPLCSLLRACSLAMRGGCGRHRKTLDEQCSGFPGRRPVFDHVLINFRVIWSEWYFGMVCELFDCNGPFPLIIFRRRHMSPGCGSRDSLLICRTVGWCGQDLATQLVGLTTRIMVLWMAVVLRICTREPYQP